MLSSDPRKDEDSHFIRWSRRSCDHQEERSGGCCRHRQAHGPLVTGRVWKSQRSSAPVSKKTPVHAPWSSRVCSEKLCPLCSREKANLAVTLANGRGDVVAHAALLDHPVAGLVDQSQWETYLENNFVAQQCTVRPAKTASAIF